MAKATKSVNEKQALETMMVLTLFFIFVAYKHQEHLKLWLSAGAFSLLIGLFVKPLSLRIAVVWFKIPEILSPLMTKLVLGFIFYIFVLPISKLVQWTGGVDLQLDSKVERKSMWITRDHKCSKSDLENIW